MNNLISKYSLTLFITLIALSSLTAQNISIEGANTSTAGSTESFGIDNSICSSCGATYGFQVIVPAGGSVNISQTYTEGTYFFSSQTSLNVTFNEPGIYGIAWFWNNHSCGGCGFQGNTPIHTIRISPDGSGGSGGSGSTSSSCCDYALELGNSSTNKIVDLIHDNSSNDILVLEENNNGIALTKQNGLGEIMWNKKIDSDSKPISLIKSSLDNTFYITAEKENDVVIYKVNNNGIVQWAKKYGLTTNDENTPDTKPYLVPTSGNNYFLMFNTQVNDLNNLGLIKISATGNKLLSKTFGTSENFPLIYEHHISDGSNGVISVGGAIDHTSIIYRINSSGNLTTQKGHFISGSTNNKSARNYRAIKVSGGYVTLAAKNISGNNYNIELRKYDNSFEVQWSKTILKENHRWLIEKADLTTDNNGNIFVGYINKTLSDASNSSASLLRFSTSGDLLSKKSYNSNIANIVLDFSDNNCDNLLIGMTKNAGQYGSSDMAISKSGISLNNCLFDNDNHSTLNNSLSNTDQDLLHERAHTFQSPNYTVLSTTNLSYSINDICSSASFCDLQANFTYDGTPFCAGEPIQFTNTSFDGLNNINQNIWYFNDGSPANTNQNPTHTFEEGGTYEVKLVIGNNNDCVECYDTIIQTIVIPENCPQPCENCIGSFSPNPGKKYVISGWAKEATQNVNTTNYQNPFITIDFSLAGGNTQSVGPFETKGLIIDGWQQIESEFVVPLNTVDITLHLKSNSGTVYFDDIRVFPFDGSMTSFVYDPVSLKLTAELDERNYATFYEYDEEGKLVRVKKETERGIMTIKETKSFTKKTW